MTPLPVVVEVVMGLDGVDPRFTFNDAEAAEVVVLDIFALQDPKSLLFKSAGDIDE
jgi:hypothetical protein